MQVKSEDASNCELDIELVLISHGVSEDGIVQMDEFVSLMYVASLVRH